ncbi:SIMPL domain-containing protein [Methylobacterium sp. JK268]
MPFPHRLAALVFGFVTALGPARVEDRPCSPAAASRVLALRGSGEHRQKPDKAEITVSVETKGRTLQEAAAAHGERLARARAVVDGLAENGVTIEKASFSLTEERESPGAKKPPEEKEPMRDKAQTSMTLKAASLDRLNDVITRLASSGVVEISRIEFQVADDRIAGDEARRAAVRDARAQAAVFADAADVALGEIVEITGADVSQEHS